MNSANGNRSEDTLDRGLTSGSSSTQENSRAVVPALNSESGALSVVDPNQSTTQQSVVEANADISSTGSDSRYLLVGPSTQSMDTQFNSLSRISSDSSNSTETGPSSSRQGPPLNQQLPQPINEQSRSDPIGPAPSNALPLAPVVEQPKASDVGNPFQWSEKRKVCNNWLCPLEGISKASDAECPLCYQGVPSLSLLSCYQCNRSVCIVCYLRICSTAAWTRKEYSDIGNLYGCVTCPFCRDVLGNNRLDQLQAWYWMHTEDIPFKLLPPRPPRPRQPPLPLRLRNEIGGQRYAYRGANLEEQRLLWASLSRHPSTTPPLANVSAPYDPHGNGPQVRATGRNIPVRRFAVRHDTFASIEAAMGPNRNPRAEVDIDPAGRSRQVISRQEMVNFRTAFGASNENNGNDDDVAADTVRPLEDQIEQPVRVPDDELDTVRSPDDELDTVRSPDDELDTVRSLDDQLEVRSLNEHSSSHSL